MGRRAVHVPRQRAARRGAAPDRQEPSPSRHVLPQGCGARGCGFGTGLPVVRDLAAESAL